MQAYNLKQEDAFSCALDMEALTSQLRPGAPILRRAESRLPGPCECCQRACLYSQHQLEAYQVGAGLSFADPRSTSTKPRSPSRWTNRPACETFDASVAAVRRTPTSPPASELRTRITTICKNELYCTCCTLASPLQQTPQKDRGESGQRAPARVRPGREEAHQVAT